MEIIGWLTLALAVGAIARALYDGTPPERLLPTFIVGFAGLGLGVALSAATGLGAVTSPGEVTSWLTALTSSCLVVGAYETLRSVMASQRAVGQLSGR